MDYGICTTPFIPLRGKASDASEMVTCLLFGETFAILQTMGNWHYVKMTYDAYEGWLFGRNIEVFSGDSPFTENQEQQYLAAFPFQKIINGNQQLYLGLGTQIPFFDGKYCFLKSATYQLQGRAFEATPDLTNSLTMAEKFLGTPYVWGGRSSFGVDCSGFTQIILRYADHRVSRDAKDQIQEGKPVNTLKQSKPGDLAFFANQDGKIVHTGIITDSSQIIHASEKVRKDPLTEEGIWHEELGYYTHNLAGIRSYLN